MLLLALVALLGGCAGVTSAPPPPPVPPVALATSVAPGAVDVAPAEPLVVSAAGGRLTSVTVTPAGAPALTGTLDPTGTRWTSATLAARIGSPVCTPGCTRRSHGGYASEENFLLAAFVFEDVGVTAYKGAAPLIDNATFLEAAAGILAVEAYHAANIRTAIVAKGMELQQATVTISDARDSLDGTSDLDQGMLLDGQINIVPADTNSIAFSRTPGQVLNVVYLTPQQATSGGFLPAGTNGEINQSDNNA